MKTRFTELLGIEHPIMQGGMNYVAENNLAAAVSNAGGLGTIPAACLGSTDNLRTAIRELKTMTDKPFAVNISMLPDLATDDPTEKFFKVCCDEGVAAVETSGNSPEAYKIR